MKLQDHPAIHWPPTWSGSYNIDVVDAPVFDQGVLQDVQSPGPLGETNIMEPPHLTLAVEYEGNSFGGMLVVDDTSLLEPLYHKLREWIGRPIHEIGNAEIDL